MSCILFHRPDLLLLDGESEQALLTVELDKDGTILVPSSPALSQVCVSLPPL